MLVANILWRALADWARVCAVGHYPRYSIKGWAQWMGFADESAELESFFRSSWCRTLAVEAFGNGEDGYVAYLRNVKSIKDCGGDWHGRRPRQPYNIQNEL